MKDEMRKLYEKWSNPQNVWPKMLESLKITGLRGWTGQTVDFNSPFVVIAGENGAGKSTVLQAAASSYLGATQAETYFPSDFFPDTTWDSIRQASIEYRVHEGKQGTSGKIDKLTNRWRNLDERKKRNVVYLDLGRMQPIGSMRGSARVMKAGCKEVQTEQFPNTKADRFSFVIGREYDGVKFSLTDKNDDLWVQVVTIGSQYSCFHQGTGEASVAAFLRSEIPNNSLVLIDEIESSLHPRAQRRMIQDLAQLCRNRSLQIIVTTHSPYVLNEFPQESRICILLGDNGREVLTGVSAEFAMTQMDDEVHPEVEIWVEDEEAKVFLEAILSHADQPLLARCVVLRYGSCEVGKSLGTMKKQKRFNRHTLVYLDGDQPESQGCNLLPGCDAPERAVFVALQKINWNDVHKRLNREQSRTAKSLSTAMTFVDHHEWLDQAATRLSVSKAALWHVMTASWVDHFGATCCNEVRDCILECLGEKTKQFFKDPTTKDKEPQAPPVIDVVLTPVISKPANGQRLLSFWDEEDEEETKEVDADAVRERNTDFKHVPFETEKFREMEADSRYDQ